MIPSGLFEDKRGLNDSSCIIISPKIYIVTHSTKKVSFNAEQKFLLEIGIGGPLV